MLRASLFPSVVVALAACLSASVAFGHGDLDRQIAEVSARIETELRQPVDGPRRAQLHFDRGELHRLHGDWRRAQADYDQAIRYQPDLHAVELARARLLLDTGRPRRAKQAVEKFLSGQVDHPEGLFLQAQILVKLGWGLKAVSFIDRAIARIAQPEPDHYLARADILASLGDRQLPRAIAGLDEGIKRLGPLVSLDSRAIDLELKLGRHDSALGRVDRQAAATIRKDMWLARRAQVLDRAGRRQEARASRQQALGAIATLPAHVQNRQATMDLKQQLVSALAAR
jgi:tetratricopeptide (TPR) repeat protein